MRTDLATFSRAQPQPDGRGGSIVAGDLTPVHQTRVELVPLKASRNLEAANLSLKPGYRLTFWNDPAYQPAVGDVVECQGVRLAIQSSAFTDATQRKYVLTGLSL